MRTRLLSLVTSLSAVCLLAGACKSDEGNDDPAAKGGSCDPTATSGATSCAEGLTCAQVQGGASNVCAAPLSVRGKVFDAATNLPIAGARVTAFEEGSAPASDTVVTDAEGNYELEVVAPRTAEGTLPAAAVFTLAAAAQDYVPYPSGVRPSLTVSGSDAVNTDPTVDNAPDVIDNGSTQIGLQPLANAGGVTISGTVSGTNAHPASGALVTVEGLGSATAPSAVADSTGAYAIYNVPAGSASVHAYRGGLDVVPVDVTIAAADVVVDLSSVSDAGASVAGSVNIVNAPGGSLTSVVLVPSSVYNDALERGPVPYGLRAPEPGIAPNVGGAFTISGVPAGTYRVLAAFENDLLVRDPDTSIAGTTIPEITVSAGQAFDVMDSFKITEALAVRSPGAMGVEEVSGTPTFVFENDSAEDRYEVVVYDALGTLVWEKTDVVPPSGSADVSVDYAGPALTAGAYYQFRATSVKDAQGGPVRLSRTEDLRGVFRMAL